MRTNLPFILHRLALNVAESGTDVTLSWLVWPAGTAVDPTNQSKVADDTHQPTVGTASLKAFVHAPDLGSAQVRQFNEIETGDLILDFAPDADLDGKEGLEFTVAGVAYVPKPISQRLARAWDVIFQGEKLLRPVLVRLKT